MSTIHDGLSKDCVSAIDVERATAVQVAILCVESRITGVGRDGMLDKVDWSGRESTTHVTANDLQDAVKAQEG